MRKVLGALAMALLLARPLGAQERVEEADLPDEVADSIIVFFNDPGTIRFNGRGRVPAGRTIVGDVGVLDGPFTVSGLIRGDLMVLNGNLTVEEGGRVEGDVTVVGGDVLGLPEGSVSGALVIYEERMPYASRGGEVRRRGGPRTERRGIRLGDSRLTVRAGTNYNRVEGLPVLFGPVFRTSGENPLRMEALAIWRTESGYTRDDLGYRIRLEQQLGVPALVTFGATAFSEVAPVEDWGLRDLEASLATFFLHRDYRDYYERQGFSLFAQAHLPGTPLQAKLSYRNEEHLDVPVASPWTLRRNDQSWRPLPLMGTGDLQTLGLALTLDNRNDPDDPTDGWWIQGHVTRGIGGALTRRDYLRPAPEETEDAAPVSSAFTDGFLDVRRYARVGPDADMAFRGLLAGSLGSRDLPSQFQHAMGGEGSLPGFRRFSQDCGARDETFAVTRERDGQTVVDPVYARYGCDRIALFQVEYRGRFSLDLGLDPDDEQWERWDWYPAVDLSPAWTVFFDAGRGWSRIPGAPNTNTVADVGAGLLLGNLGVYWAYPLTGDDRHVNFFVRLKRRF